ncbi:MAG: ABC transporter ATP-binding protein [Alphaproteobacteria bacterium]|nr:ABC transporter ATP-binding protein [Alphaproteobacteria bacterium]
MPDDLLIAEKLEAGYPGKRILLGVDFAVRRGEAVVLLGANGSGKSTALNAVSGFVRPTGGRILLDGEDIAGLPPHRVFAEGVVQVSQARDLFPDMSVEDNLRLGAARRKDADVPALLARVYLDFPRLAERRGQRVRTMSGGEQQMVAIARALMGTPKILLLDEPSGGLAPRFVSEIASIVARLKAAGTTMLIVEQNIKLALDVADRFLVLKSGLVAERGDVTRATSQEAIVRSIYL